MLHLLKPQDAVRAPIAHVGGKARTLAHHLCRGLPVPGFVVVPPTGWDETSLEADLADLLGRLGPLPWMVRSSSPREDVAGDSHAGLYMSCRVDEAHDVADAMRRVRRSGGEESPIPLIIQQCVRARAAGVAFSRSPMKPWESVVEAAVADTAAVTGGRVEPERWARDRRRRGWAGPARSGGCGPRVLTQEEAEAVLDLVRELEDWSTGMGRDVEWALCANGIQLLQDRPATSDPGTSDYFLPERFPQGVSPLGWSLLGPVIQKVAIEDPLEFLGSGNRIHGSAVVVRHNTPYLKRATVSELFRYFPARIVPDEVLRENATLRLPWIRRVLTSPPRPLSVLRTLLTESDWFPPVHRFRWFRFIRRLDAALDSAPLTEEWIRSARTEELVSTIDCSLAWTRDLLQLHRWSLVHAELMWRITSIRPGEQPAHATARVLGELTELRASGDDADLAGFLDRHGHRSDGIDPIHPTWRESPDRVQDLIHMQVPAPSPPSRRRLPVRGPIRTWRRFVLDLREEQRHHWHRILSRLRMVSLEAGHRLVDRGCLESVEDVFRLERDELLDALSGSPVSKLALGRSLPTGAGSLPRSEPATGGRLVLRGIGVSSGRVRGAVRRVETAADLAALPAGAILVTRAADPAWAPAFGKIGALVQELGGTLSHAAIVARETGLPAVMGVRGVTGRLSDGDLVEVDGRTGTVIRRGWS